MVRQIQLQNSKGSDHALLVASPSMLSSVKRDENHSKDDGVICDLLFFKQELGGLHLFTFVNSGSQDQFLPYSHATVKAVKESLVMSDGCYEKFYITPHVVPCDRVGSEPLYELSPDSLYPKGAGGTGETVVAVEFIRELLRRDPNLGYRNILYVCENVGLRVKIGYVSD